MAKEAGIYFYFGLGVISIKTFQDFLEVGESENDKMQFILAAINDHKSGDLYKTAVDAEMYYMGENPTINRYEKILYDMQGKAHVDMWTANHKIASPFFHIAVDQENGYLLGNGVTFNDAATKDKLGTQRVPFDQQILRAGKRASIGGVAYLFWNYDHVEVFDAKEFVPLVDEENGAIKAGIRFWQLDDNKPLRATLFELDGYTDYIKRKGEDMTILADKRAYITRTIGSAVDRARGDAIYEFENYPGFPIVPLLNNEWMKSEICGKRSTIDALDLATSGMVNNVDEGNLIYWVLTNAGGMDDIDDQRFLERLKTLHVVHVEDDIDATPHSIEAPFDGTQVTIDMLQKRLYQDFQAFDASAVSAGNQTATAINATYVPMDLKVDNKEPHVTKAINALLDMLGITDEPSYTRNKLINKQEEMQTLLMAAPYLTDEYITTKALTIMGDPDMAEDIIKQQDAENLSRFSGTVTETDEITEEIQGGNLND